MSERITARLPLEGLLFWKLDGREALSHSFELTVTLLGADARIERHALLGQPLTLDIPTGRLLAGTRHLNGKITRVSVKSEELNGTRQAVYELTIEPDLWPMKRDKNSRIFQGQTAVQIIHQLLGEFGVQVEDRLTGSYREWEYCVQYHESSLDFISRLMELEGIYWWFRHEADRHVMVLADAPEAHEAWPGYEYIPYHVTGSGGVTSEEGISQWTLEDSVTPGMYSIDDYDFRKPNAWLLQARQNPASPQPGQTEVYEWPGRFVEHAQGEKYVRVRQEAWQAAHRQTQGKGTALGLAPGCTFALLNAPHGEDNGTYLTLETTYKLQENRYVSGGGDETQHHIGFRVLPATVVYRKEATTPWPKTHGPQTARVVGPQGESIYTDRYGRIKVKFHWDRLAKGDETSSCWVRVSSAWAGQGYGGVQIPRVNDEVVVDFINGDPDRPIVTGRVYNAASMPPWALPGAATQMGFMSRSKDGTPDNANVLRFEDRAGEEQVWIQAERNMDVNVKNDATRHIGSNHSHYVRKNELHREANQIQAVKGGTEILTGQGKLDATVEQYVLASGSQLRLVCGNSAIELNASGQINLVGKGFNLFVEGDGNITTSGGKLNLNTAGAKPGTTAPGPNHKQDIKQAVEAKFTPGKEGKGAAPQKTSHAIAPAVTPPANTKKATNKPDKIDDNVVRSVMASEGSSGEQGGRPELYGFRKGNGKDYDHILAARKKYGIGSQEEFNAVSNAMTRSAKQAGALNFSDPGKQAAITSLAHMRGPSGAQAILNSMDTGEIVKADTLTSQAIKKIDAMAPEDFQNELVKARVAYDKKIYGDTITTQGGKQYNWWERYGNGLQKRYTREASEFLKFSKE